MCVVRISASSDRPQPQNFSSGMAQPLPYREWAGHVGRLVVSDQYPHDPGTLCQRGTGFRASFYLEWPASSHRRWQQVVKPFRDTVTLCAGRPFAGVPLPAPPQRTLMATTIEEDDFEVVDTVRVNSSSSSPIMEPIVCTSVRVHVCTVLHVLLLLFRTSHVHSLAHSLVTHTHTRRRRHRAACLSVSRALLSTSPTRSTTAASTTRSCLPRPTTSRPRAPAR